MAFGVPLTVNNVDVPEQIPILLKPTVAVGCSTAIAKMADEVPAGIVAIHGGVVLESTVNMVKVVLVFKLAVGISKLPKASKLRL